MTIESIIDVTLTSNSLAGYQKSFAYPLIYGKHAAFSDAARVYDMSSVLTDLVADGIPTTHPIYRTAQSLGTANPSPSKVVVGRMTGTIDQEGTLEVVAIPDVDEAISFVVRNALGVPTTISYTIQSGDDTDAAASAIQGLLTAVSGITATVLNSVISWSVDTSDEVWTFESLNKKHIAFEDSTPAPTSTTIAADFIEIGEATNIWYGGLHAGPQSVAINNAISTVFESLEKFFGALTFNNEDEDAASTTSLSYTLSAANRFRTGVLFSGDQTVHAMAALFSKMMPYDPGRATWEFKTVSATADKVSGAARTAFEQNNTIYFEVDVDGDGGYDLTRNSKTSGGEWIDVVIFRDWLVAKLREYVIRLLANAPKVPYTKSGVIQVVKEVKAVLKLGRNNEGIDPDFEFTVTYPEIADIPTTTRQNRILPDIKFSARLAGAIHAVQITGALLV